MDPYPCNRVIANVLFKTSYLESWGKYEKLLHKNKCTTKSHSWRFGPQRAETFSRIADLKHLIIDSAISRRRQRLLRKLTKMGLHTGNMSHKSA